MAVIGSLTVKLGLVTLEWDKATAKAKQDAKDLQSAFGKLGLDMNNLKQLFTNLGGAAGLSVAGLTAMTAAIMDMASKMQDLADSTGLTEGRVLQFQKALVVAGGKAEDAGTILGALFTKIAAARDGNDTAIAQFEQLGITFAELKTSTPDEVIKKVYDGLSQISDSFERVRVTKELLGKAGLGKSITDIADALGKSTKKFDEQAETLQKWDKQADALEQTYANLKMAIAELLAPFTTTKVATVEQFKAAIFAIGSALVVSQIMNLVAAFKALNTALKGTVAISAAISSLKGGKGLAMGATALAVYAGAMKAMGDEEEEAVQSVEGKVEPAKLDEKEGKQGGSEAAKMRMRLELVKQQLKFDLQRLQIQSEAIGGSQLQAQLAENALQKEQEIAQARAAYAEAIAKENLTSEQQGIIEEEYMQKVKRTNALHNARADLIRQQTFFTGRLQILETDQLEVRLNLQKNILAFDEESYKVGQAEVARQRAQFDMEQKLLGLKQERERLDIENRSEEARAERGYKERVRQIQLLEAAAKAEYETRANIVDREERMRMQFIDAELKGLRKRNDLINDSLTLNNNARYLNEFQLARAQEELDLQMRLLDIEQQKQNLRISGRASTPEGEDEMTRLSMLEIQARKEAEIRREGIKLDEQEAMSWSAGWAKAMREFAQNSQRYGDVAGNMFNSVVGNMNSAIDNFVRTGKLSFKDLAKSIIQDLIAIQLKAQAAFLFNQALQGMGFSGFTAKAGGGAVSQSIPYMVGENGPELFIPQSGGAIIPNQRMGGDMGIGGQTINYNGPYIQNMSAIDTQTASQFLAKNKMAVWSANQSATRSLPQGR